MCSAVADIEACIPALRLHASALLRDRQDVDDLVRACLARISARDAVVKAWLSLDPDHAPLWVDSLLVRRHAQLHVRATPT